MEILKSRYADEEAVRRSTWQREVAMSCAENERMRGEVAMLLLTLF